MMLGVVLYFATNAVAFSHAKSKIAFMVRANGRTLDAPAVTQENTKAIIEASRKKDCTPKKKVEEMLLKWDEAPSAPPKKEEMNAEEAFEEPLI